MPAVARFVALVHSQAVVLALALRGGSSPVMRVVHIAGTSPE